MKRTAVATLGLLAFILSISTFALVRPARDAGPETMAQLQTAAPVNISNTPYDSGYPLIGLDANGAAYVVWLEYPDYDVLFRPIRRVRGALPNERRPSLHLGSIPTATKASPWLPTASAIS